MKCTPITIGDIIPDQPYIAVGVAVDGSMRITYPVFGEPVKDDSGSWWIRTDTEKNPPQPLPRSGSDLLLCGFRSVSDFGLDPENRYNHHRVFEHNDENHRVLMGLVERQDLVAYFTLIGVEEPLKAIAVLQLRLEESGHIYEPFLDEMIGWDDWIG